MIERDSMGSGRLERFVLAFLLALALPHGAHAEPAFLPSVVPNAVRLHFVSWHDRGGFDNANLGAALRWNGGLVAGGFNNSYGRPSWYGGLVVPAFESRLVQLELMAGVISGYSEVSPVDVVAAPILGWRLSPRNSLQFVLIPRFVIPANAVHVMFERRLGDIAGRPGP